MKFNFTGNIEEVAKGLSLLTARLGYKLDVEGFSVEVEKRNGNLEVIMNENKAVIRYQDKIHFFRALGLLIENRSEQNSFNIIETPKFKTSGIMVDVSRNAVLKVDSIKDFLEIMAVMGLNMMMLYTEDTYKIESKPYFGYMRGRYSYDELKSCDDYADIFGIEMVPCIQTLGHLSEALKWSYAADIKDTDDILFVGEEKTYAFIEEMIHAATAPFRSKRIHLGMDEAHHIGLGKYLTKNGYSRRFDIMNKHLEQVRKITDKFGLKAMIWSDMYFRLGSKTGDYYDLDANIPQDIIHTIPKDIQLVFWDYYHNKPEEYTAFIKRHKLFGCDILFAGGIWTWIGSAVNYGKTFATTNAALTVYKEEGIDEVFATMWGDNGAEANIFSGLLGLQLYAEHGYTDTVDNDLLKKRFKICTGGDADAFLSISKLDCLPQDTTMNAEATVVNPSKTLLWQDILIGLFDKHVEDMNLPTFYKQLAEELKNHAQQAGKFQFIFDMPAKLADVLSKKCELGIQIKACYTSNDLKGLNEFCTHSLPELYNDVQILRQEHRTQWLTAYKPFGWEIIDIRYGGLLARIDTARYRLTQYLNQEITIIDELEEERLPFEEPLHTDNSGMPYCNKYQRIISACPLG